MRVYFIFGCFLQLILFSHTIVKAADFVNFIGMEFGNIEKGQFKMGACNNLFTEIKQPLCKGVPNDPVTFSNELPRHSVEIIQPFQIGTYEVSVANFRHYVQSNTISAKDRIIFKIFNQGAENLPVVYVSWEEIQKFIIWINNTKPDSDTGTYRLPTEAEWEYVARAGTGTIYFFGNSSKQLAQYAWYNSNSLEIGDISPRPIGTKKANPWGVFDIYGNVWEWTSDYYEADHYQKSIHRTPSGPSKGSLKTIRGGSWNFDETYCRSTAREAYQPRYRSRSIGFRIIREIKE